MPTVCWPGSKTWAERSKPPLRGRRKGPQRVVPKGPAAGREAFPKRPAPGPKRAPKTTLQRAFEKNSKSERRKSCVDFDFAGFSGLQGLGERDRTTAGLDWQPDALAG